MTVSVRCVVTFLRVPESVVATECGKSYIHAAQRPALQGRKLEGVMAFHAANTCPPSLSERSSAGLWPLLSLGEAVLWAACDLKTSCPPHTHQPTHPFPTDLPTPIHQPISYRLSLPPLCLPPLSLSKQASEQASKQASKQRPPSPPPPPQNTPPL